MFVNVPMKWRWIHSGRNAGALQMARDQAALLSARETGCPTLRVYGWEPYCVSLGRHQDAACMDLSECEKAGIDVVRRPTGGRAVYHAREVTYSVIIPRNHPVFYSSVSRVYNRISRGLCSGIQQLGVAADLTRRTPDLRAHYRNPLSVSCFSASARNEVMIQGRKLIGSAQRQTAEGLLQHGSILLDDEHLNLPDFLAGVDRAESKRMKAAVASRTISLSEALGRKVTFEETAEAVCRGMSRVFEARFESHTLTDEEENRARSMVHEFAVFTAALPGTGKDSSVTVENNETFEP